MKDFEESLHDGFLHITSITDPDLLAKFRDEGIRVDDEGYYSFSFGEKHEYTLQIEPFGEEGSYYVALYKTGILLIPKLPIWSTRQEQP